MQKLQAQLAAAQRARRQLEANNQELQADLQEAGRRVRELQEQQKQQAQAQHVEGKVAAELAEAQARLKRVQADRAELQQQVKQLRQQAATDAAKIQHLAARLDEQKASSRQAAGTRVEGKHPQEQEQQHSGSTQGQAVPPLTEGAAASAEGLARSRAEVSVSGRLAAEGDEALEGPPPSLAAQAQFRAELPHALEGHERQGVVSRFAHPLPAVMAMRRELEGELEAELQQELASFGLNPQAERLSSEDYRAALVELAQRRSAMRDAMSAPDLERMNYMRSTVQWHVGQAAAACGGPGGGAGSLLASRPAGLKPIREHTTSFGLRSLPGPGATADGDSPAQLSPVCVRPCGLKLARCPPCRDAQRRRHARRTGACRRRLWHRAAGPL